MLGDSLQSMTQLADHGKEGGNITNVVPRERSRLERRHLELGRLCFATHSASRKCSRTGQVSGTKQMVPELCD